MLVYSASVLFHAGRHTNTYPSFATDKCYENIDSFIDYCELNARANPMFPTSDVCINAMICRANEDGTVQKERVQPDPRFFRNYKG